MRYYARTGRRLTPQQEAEAVKLFLEHGWSVGRIGVYLDRSHSTISRMLRRHGIPPRTGPAPAPLREQDWRAPNGAPRNYNDAHVLAVQAVTYSTKRTALLLGMPVGSVKSILRRDRLRRAAA